MPLIAHGLSLPTGPGLEARVYRRPPDGSGEQTFPVAHLATFALPPERGDYGNGAIELMRDSDVFLALLEFDPPSARTALFAMQGRPPLAPADFQPARMQRPMPPRTGRQYFYTEAGRPFCLFVVLGSHASRRDLAPVAQGLLDRIEVAPVAASAPTITGRP